MVGPELGIGPGPPGVLFRPSTEPPLLGVREHKVTFLYPLGATITSRVLDILTNLSLVQGLLREYQSTQDG
jgi:hypothetical protein